jgi:site-specific DNA-methyltransferase (adenine-specific)
MAQINFYNVDNMKFMASKPDNYYDLAIVDPPYGINAGKMTMGSGKHKFKKDKDWDNGVPSKEFFDELFRVSSNQIIWGGNYFTEFLPPSPHWLLWDKKNPNLSFAEGELAWVRNGKNLRIFYKYSAMVDKGGKRHPTQKSIDLYRWCLQNYATPGMKILDTHGGSMTHAIACDLEGYDLDLCEIDNEYFDDGVAAFNLHKSQKRLF